MWNTKKSQIFGFFLLLPAIALPAALAFSPASTIIGNRASSSLLKATTASLVWLTGYEDLRFQNHGGFSAALEEENIDIVQPVFVLDPEIHLKSKSNITIKRLHKSLTSLEQEINIWKQRNENNTLTVAPLLLSTGCASTILPSLAQALSATVCHVIENDVVTNMRTMQQETCQSLTDHIQVKRWTNALRPKLKLSTSLYPEYCEMIKNFKNKESTLRMIDKRIPCSREEISEITRSVLPSLEELVELSQSVTPSAVREFRELDTTNTAEPFEELIANQWITEQEVTMALLEYCQLGKDDFANQYYAQEADYKNSMYAASIGRILQDNKPSEVLALREVPTRTFSSALSLGTLSPNTVLQQVVDDDYSKKEWWGRSSKGSLVDMIEWREWFRLLADRSLILQEVGEKDGNGSKNKPDDPTKVSGYARESGTVHYWRWKEQYLIRYLTWPAGKDYTPNDKHAHPAILLVHGFAASAEQWERLVYCLRQEYLTMNDGLDQTPPIFAIDLLGFGYAEKPGLSYTQYLWESQLVDFAMEVMDASPMIMVGNSIGGGLSAGAASTLGKDICQGLVLCNTAGLLIDPDVYSGYTVDNHNVCQTIMQSHTEAARMGNPNEAPYCPVPVVGNNVLDVFGTVIIELLYPRIESLLSTIYGNRIENADPAVVSAIQQSASSPGSANVIGSGQKLAPNRPLNEVLLDVKKVLAVVGLDDRVSSPQVAKRRANLFSKMPEVDVKVLSDAGHCPHDEKPELVANAIVEWLVAK
mmetsp:Transcript_16745/g.25305  ORF Transcript_16745/g.25305 Transcript_16745/m.25305 type:complete len:760 (+) Transcript_16745:146-2425(+)